LCLGILTEVPLLAFMLEFFRIILHSTSPSSSNPINIISVITAYTVSEEDKLFPTRQNFSYYAFQENVKSKTEYI